MSTPDSLPADHVRLPVIRLREGAAEGGRAEDAVAEETPVALEYNGISHATMLATPADLEDFALGFSLSEGIIDRPGDVRGIDVAPQCGGVVVQVEISSACEMRLKARRRAMAGRTGCGLCGLESLDEVQRALPALPRRPAFLDARAVSAAVDALRELQPLHLRTGATHAAGWADLQGRIQAVREDVGRHNALDKLIGHLLRQGLDTSAGFAVISSRASFEMVQKAAAAGIPAVVAVSAPTTYAVQMAAELNVLLAGFARKNVFTVYAHPESLIPYESP